MHLSVILSARSIFVNFSNKSQTSNLLSQPTLYMAKWSLYWLLVPLAKQNKRKHCTWQNIQLVPLICYISPHCQCSNIFENYKSMNKWDLTNSNDNKIHARKGKRLVEFNAKYSSNLAENIRKAMGWDDYKKNNWHLIRLIHSSLDRAESIGVISPSLPKFSWPGIYWQELFGQSGWRHELVSNYVKRKMLFDWLTSNVYEENGKELLHFSATLFRLHCFCVSI